jgi:hypothetical protein
MIFIVDSIKTRSLKKSQVFDPSSPSCKRWKLSAAECSAVANALSFPPGEYARKSETQRN